MQTIRLQVHDKIYTNLMWLLKKFRKDEIEVISENKEFLSVQSYLKKELKEIKNGKAKFLSIGELEKDLEETIKKYENKD